MAPSNDSRVNVVARYAVAIYFAALLMMLMPPLDIILSLPQYQLGSARWRFGAAGMVSGAMLVPILGLLIASMTAAYAQHRWVQRLLLAVSVLVGASFLAVLVLFALDAVQVRRETVVDVRRRYDVTVLKTLLMQLTQIVAVGLIGRSTWVASQSLDAEREARRTPELYAGMASR